MSVKYNALQELRAILSLMVLAFHCHLPGTSIFWAAVEVFFCISGYFIFQKLLEHKEKSLLSFMVGRIKRIYFPAYLIVVLCFNFALMVLMGEFRLHKSLYYVFGLQNYGLSELILDDNSISIHTWTVAVELQMIIIITLLTYIYDKLKIRREAVLMTLAIFTFGYGVVAYYFMENIQTYGSSPMAHAFSFALGGYIYVRSRKKKKLGEDIANLVIGILLFLFICYRVSVYLECSLHQAFATFSDASIHLDYGLYMILVFPALALIGGSLMGLSMRIPNERCKNKYLIKAGDDSYILYLFHFPIVSILFASVDNSYVVFGLSLILTLAVSYGYLAIVKTIKKK